MLGFGPSKTTMLILTGMIRSVKVGHHRHILPEWVDEYVTRVASEEAPA